MRDRNRSPAQIKSVHQNSCDHAVANACAIRPSRPCYRNDDRHHRHHERHADGQIGQRIGAVEHVFCCDEARAPEHNKNRRRRASGQSFKVFAHLRP